MQLADTSIPPTASHLGRRVVLTAAARLLASNLPRRVVIAGGPRSGKSTLAKALGEHSRVHQMRMSDDLRNLEWSESSRVASEWFDLDAPWVCEGVVMPRALRKWLARVPEGVPADLIIWTNSEATHRVPGQQAMAKGCETVFREILPELRRRGAHVVEV